MVRTEDRFVVRRSVAGLLVVGAVVAWFVMTPCWAVATDVMVVTFGWTLLPPEVRSGR
jgi:hypothetical protein